MNWKISETNQLDSDGVDRRGNKFLIGNGTFGYRGTLAEFNKAQKTATIMAGLYDRVGDQWREPVNLPNGGVVQVRYRGEWLHALTSKVLAHRQTLDMACAVHERETRFQASDGTQITLRSRRFASLAQPELLCMAFSVEGDADGVVSVTTGIDGDVWDLNGPHLCNQQASAHDGVLTISAETHEQAIPVAVSEAVDLPDAVADTVAAPWRTFELPIGGRFTKIVAHAVGTADDSAAPVAESRELCAAAIAIGFDALLAAHTELWARRWQACNIEIEGDPSAETALRFSMYHLLAIVPTQSDRHSIPARGLSGQMYKGAIFWDTEIFMLPFFIYTQPDLARNLLLYRYHTLDGARRKAAAHGYRGAFFAWESQDSGDDACTLFNVTDVFTQRPMRTYFRDKQIHISADIVYAIWHYVSATGDTAILIDGGAEVMLECARFFLSYVYYSPDHDRYELLDVTGPDEYHERVHNNAFTNRMVSHVFEVCLEMADWLSSAETDFFHALIDRLDFDDDLAQMADVVAQLFAPDAVDSPTIIPQFDGYLALEDVALPDLLARKLHPHEYLGGGNGLATTTQITKQADVVLMLYLFGDRYSAETKAVNWAYYEPRTEHGSSLSACSYSLIAAQIGQTDWAYKYFMKTATIDLTGAGKQYVGTLYIGGTHPAGNGGSWMAVVNGLCGVGTQLTLDDDQRLTVRPSLPAHWRKVTLPLTLRGQSLRLTVTPNEVTIAPAQPLHAPLTVQVGETIRQITPQSDVVLPVAAAAPRPRQETTP